MSKLKYGASFIIMPWIIVFLLREFGPITHARLSEDFYIFTSIFLICAVFGCVVGLTKKTVSSIGKECSALKQPELDLKFVSSASLFYLLMVAFDFFVMKGGSLSEITAIREEDNLIGARMSSLGGVIAIASAAPFILLSKIRYDRIRNGVKGSVTLQLLSICGVLASFLSGGRNAFLIGISVYLCQSFILRQKLHSTKKSKNRTISVFLFAGVLFSFYIFLDRELNQGVDLQGLVQIFAVKWNVDITELRIETSIANAVYAALTMLIFYITHALNYFDHYLISGVSPMLLGVYNNPIPAKIIDVVFGTGLFEAISNKLILSGVYLTFPGSLYLDFGYAGAILASFIIGALTGRSLRNFTLDSFVSIQVSCLLLSIWLLSPLYSVVGISNGFSFIVLLLVMKLIGFIKR